jgi:hypothetical protein
MKTYETKKLGSPFARGPAHTPVARIDNLQPDAGNCLVSIHQPVISADRYLKRPYQKR